MATYQNITAHIDFSSLESYIKQLENLRDEYRTAYTTDIYTNAMDEVKSAYGGKDSDAYITKVGEFRNDFDKMTEILEQYITHLKKVLTDYRNTQDYLEQSAKALKGDRS